jgi:GNAT superfamily N-acetyltransferase
MVYISLRKDQIVAEEIKVIEVTQDNLCESPRCGIKDTEHEGHERKTKWLKTYLKKGLKAKVLLTEKNIQFGYIEYIPGEYAWRGVEADGYMFIHCLWTFFKKYQRKGYGKFLIRACIDDAKKAKMKGVAVVARKSSWLAGSDIFLKNGFEVVGTAPPDYELLVKKFNKSAPNPKFKDNWDKKLKKYGKGLTIIRANQCPHTIRYSEKIAEMAERTYKLKPQIVELRTYRQAQNAPTPYAVFAIIYNGQLLADYQISRSRFRNIMNKILE